MLLLHPRFGARGWATLAVLVIATALVPVARADDVAEAAELFVQGRAALEAGEIDRACHLLRQSHELDPTVGAAGNHAQCEARRGRLASALRAWRETIRLAEQTGDSRRDPAAEAAKALEPRVPRLRLVPPAGAPTTTVVVVNDVGAGKHELGLADLDQPIFVDPGSVMVTVKAPGHEARRHDVAMAEGEKRELQLTLGPIDWAPPAEPPTDGPLAAWPAWVAGGIGVAGLTVMGVTGAMAMSRHNSSKELARSCSSRGVGCAEGRSEREAAQSMATVSTIGLATGIAGIGAATGLLIARAVSKPSTSGTRIEPVVSPQGAWLGIRSAF